MGITLEQKNLFWKKLEGVARILITSHISPDPDSFGSTLGLFEGIRSRFPRASVRIAYSGAKDPHATPLHNMDKIEFAADIANLLTEVDLLIELDASQYLRVSNEPDRLVSFSPKICVDHHVSPPDEWDLSIIDTSAASCSQMVFELIESEPISKGACEAMLLGIMADTGGFRYMKPGRTHAMSVAADLIERGNIDVQELLSRFDGIPVATFTIIQELMRNLKNVEVAGRTPFSWSFVSREFMEKGCYSDADMSAAKNKFVPIYMRNIEGFPWGFTVMPATDGVSRVSSRSLLQGENVRLILESMGIGGGHDLAAGGTFKDEPDPQRAGERLIEWLRTHPAREAK